MFPTKRQKGSGIGKEDPAIVTKSLVNDFDYFIAKLSSDHIPNTTESSAAKHDKPSKMSFASVLHNQSTKRWVNIKELRNDEKVEGVAVAIPLSAVEEVSARFSYTLYGYFIRKWLAFPLMENYAKNTWVKFRLKRVMLDEGFFLFQFETKDGMDRVIEGGPWLIRLVPLILNVWTPNTILKKDEIKTAPIWVKLHNVPIMATEYARALVEVSAEKELMAAIVITIPYSDGKGHTLATIGIEYEWKPPHCKTCKIFDHTNKKCPKLPKEAEPVLDTNDGFVEVNKKKGKVKQLFTQPSKPRQVARIRFTKPKLNLQYRRVEHGASSESQHKGETSNATKQDQGIEQSSKPSSSSALNVKDVSLSNSFAALGDEEDTTCSDETNWLRAKQKLTAINESDSEECEDPFNSTLREHETMYVQAFNDAVLLEEHFLKQKAKVEWLRAGDSNTAYFHKAVKSRISRSRIEVVMDTNGTLFANEQVVDAFVNRYEAFHGQSVHTGTFDIEGLFLNTMDNEIALSMVLPMTEIEVKEAIFLMGNDKAPGPDGFTAAFFKEAWDIVSKDVIKAVQEFFLNGKLLKELNHTIIALIPKLDRGSSRCAFKVDIQKAYDTVDWGFFKRILGQFGFYPRMIGWIMECVSTTSYSICVNGILHGHFRGKCGLMQGDPLSPYLFTLVMEVLTLMLQRRVRNSDLFTYHRYCSKMKIINLCFTDDLFLFAHGDVESARVIMDALEEFKLVSGLTPSLPKSTAYFCNVLNYIKVSILQVLPFEEGRLPVKYLGVPFISTRLIYRDCRELIEKVQNQINDWKNKSLSVAGRLQLIKSVIGSMHIYWASIFILPSRILLDLEQSMRDFLWCQGKIRRGRAKVSWDLVCRLHEEGGLGIRRMELFNQVLMVTHIWNLLVRKESLWVRWIHEYKLKGQNFWDIPLCGN
ncbi:hypothetical protein Tco_1540645 [Tanacetum coccineum]